MALDVAAGFRQQHFQDGSGCFLVVAVFRRSRRRTEGLFKEGDADAFGATHGFQGGRGPCLALHHLCKQGQPDEMTLPS